MELSKELLAQYREFMLQTNVRECYQEMIHMLKVLRGTLEKDLPDFSFTGKVVENQMDVSYFQATTQELKARGLKLQVVFIHRTCQLEVWISGYNRKIQCQYYDRLQPLQCSYERCSNPERTDYIVKTPVNKSVGVDDFSCFSEEICQKMKELERFFVGIQWGD